MASHESKLKRRLRSASEKLAQARKIVPAVKNQLSKLGKSASKAKKAVTRLRRYWRDIFRARKTRLKDWRKEHPGGFREEMLNGHPGNITDALKPEIFRAVGYGLYVTSTTDYTHATTSLHYPRNNPDGLGHAFDAGGPYDAMVKAQNAYKNNPGKYREVFGPDDWYIKNGVVYPGAFPDHGDHIHVAV